MLNGVIHNMKHEKKLAEFLQDFKFSSGAVAINNEIVHTENFSSVVIKDGDKVDIVTVVGGG